ncbi:NAD(P)/FAD-dependent oxidoreductase [Angustibacter speluncae]
MSTAPRDRTRPRVVVVGAGFGGMSTVAALRWADVDVLLVDRNGYNTFQPLLYQVATGGLNPGDVTYALRAFTSKFRNARFRQGTVVRLHTDVKQVELADGDRIDYDYLVLSTGVTANFFGIPGAKENSLLIYTRREALTTRDHLFSRLEQLAIEEGKQATTNVVVVGGGATGVEMAGTLAEMVGSALPHAYPELDNSKIKVHLVEMASDVLGPFKPSLRRYSAKALRKRGVQLHLDTAVAEVTPSEVRLKDGEVIRTESVIWATGVTAHEVVSTWGLPQGRGGRIQIGPDMRVVGFDDVFAIGDVSGDTESPLPQLAQPAIQHGMHVAETISRLLAGMGSTPFHYTDKGIMATIGRRAAVAQLPGNIGMRGTLAWLAWVALHVFFLLSNRNRLAVMTNLAVRYLSWPRNVNVILGDWEQKRSTQPVQDQVPADASGLEQPQPVSKR